jgi:hypothetical protein
MNGFDLNVSSKKIDLSLLGEKKLVNLENRITGVFSIACLAIFIFTSAWYIKIVLNGW